MGISSWMARRKLANQFKKKHGLDKRSARTMASIVQKKPTLGEGEALKATRMLQSAKGRKGLPHPIDKPTPVSPQARLAGVLKVGGLSSEAFLKKLRGDAAFRQGILARLNEAGFKRPERIAEVLQRKLEKGKSLPQIIGELEK